MTGNSIGKIFRVTTFGESHGPCLGGIIDGMPPNFPISSEDIQKDLDKRKPGKSKYTSTRSESDKVEILSGIFNGLTTGSSIGLIVRNKNHRPEDYEDIKNIYRPGHADFTYDKKYGHRDYRGGGRSSARETVIRVAAGAIAKKYLFKKCGLNIKGYLSQLGNIKCDLKEIKEIDKNPFFCPDSKKIKEIKKLISNLLNSGNSVGSKISILVNKVPIGLGDPVFDKLNASLAHALMSINAVKGIEIGDGYNVVNQYGSNSRDEINKSGFTSNHSGGILGGISNGSPIFISLFIKPTSSVIYPIKTIDKYGKEKKIRVFGRHDPCIGIRAIPIAESMTAIVLMDHFLINRAQCYDNLR